MSRSFFPSLFPAEMLSACPSLPSIRLTKCLSVVKVIAENRGGTSDVQCEGIRGT